MEIYALNAHLVDAVASYAHCIHMRARDIIKALEAEGWALTRVTGGHHHFRHPVRSGLVTVPAHGSADVKLAVLRSIEKQSGVKLRKEG